MFPAVELLDQAWFHRAAEHQSRLAMPASALGRLLPLGQQLCAIQQTLLPTAEPAAVVVMAADHGVTQEAVSAYPQQVTAQMVRTFLTGGAAINVLARRTGTRLLIVDMGVKVLPPEIGGHPGLIRLSLGHGTRNFASEPAMTEDQARTAIARGSRLTECLIAEGIQVLALGEMGIGNTTSASALAAVLTGVPVDQVTGRGTGIGDEVWQRKCRVIEQAIARHHPDPAQPLSVLAALGGFEIAGLVGVALQAASRRRLVVLDGFISSVAGLLAARLAPAAPQYLVASHLSVEIGHRHVLQALDLTPLFELGMRLGEGTGAVLALPMIQAAADLMREMLTFDSAGVSGRSSDA